MYWFTSDWHSYGVFEDRGTFTPFSSSNEMLSNLIANTNRVVDVDDTLIIVGDLCDWMPNNKDVWEDGLEVAQSLKCNVELVLGNNEIRAMEYKDLTFSEFEDICDCHGISKVHKNIKLDVGNGEWFYVTHEPKSCIRGYINVFGHIHMTGPITGLGYNVSCFINNYTPVSADKILTAKKLVHKFEIKDPSALCLFTTSYADNWRVGY